MRSRIALVLASVLAVSTAACRDDSPTGPATAPREARVFTDNFIAADYQAFAGSKLDAVSIDNAVKYSGSSSLKVTIPGPGQYSGGAFVASISRDLTQYNALTFWARASINATLDVAGLGNDNTGTSLYTSERTAIPITTTWQKYTIVIPLSSKLSAEKGLFYFAEGPEGGLGYDLWLDDIRFETLAAGVITNPRPVLPTSTQLVEVGSTQAISGFNVTFAVTGVDQVQTAFPSYFTFTSSNPTAVTVNANGVASAIASGSSNVTAALGTVAATGTVTVQTVNPPTVAAPTPTYLAADVISLFSNAYTNGGVNTWSADWDAADVTDRTIAGNAVKRYTNLTFAGIEFVGANKVNASTMTHFRIDLWTPDAITGTAAVAIKLVDWGADGNYGGGDDVEHELTFNGTSTPALTSGTWVTIDVPLTQFTNMTTKSNIAQMIISGIDALNTLYVDNVLFHK